MVSPVTPLARAVLTRRTDGAPATRGAFLLARDDPLPRRTSPSSTPSPGRVTPPWARAPPMNRIGLPQRRSVRHRDQATRRVALAPHVPAPRDERGEGTGASLTFQGRAPGALRSLAGGACMVRARRGRRQRGRLPGRGRLRDGPQDQGFQGREVFVHSAGTRPAARRTRPAAAQTRGPAWRTRPAAAQTRGSAWRTRPAEMLTRRSARRARPSARRPRPAAPQTRPYAPRSRAAATFPGSPVAEELRAWSRARRPGVPLGAVGYSTMEGSSSLCPSKTVSTTIAFPSRSMR